MFFKRLFDNIKQEYNHVTLEQTRIEKELYNSSAAFEKEWKTCTQPNKIIKG